MQAFGLVFVFVFCIIIYEYASQETYSSPSAVQADEEEGL